MASLSQPFDVGSRVMAQASFDNLYRACPSTLSVPIAHPYPSIADLSPLPRQTLRMWWTAARLTAS